MEMTRPDNFEKSALDKLSFDRLERMSLLNKEFNSTVVPENGVYGITVRDKGNGAIERIVRDSENRITSKEYYQDNKLMSTRSNLGDKRWRTTLYDDYGTAYATKISGTKASGVQTEPMKLTPNTEIHIGNQTTYTDRLGRPTRIRIEDLQLTNRDGNASQALRTSAYRQGDQLGHGAAASFGGSNGIENIVPQSSEVNQSSYKVVENEVRRLKTPDNRIDYEVKINYNGDEFRPTSFEQNFDIDGKPYEFKGEMAKYRKILNDDYTAKEKIVVSTKEKIDNLNEKTSNISRTGAQVFNRTDAMRETGRQQGLGAATITAAISTVDNVSQYTNGEISAEEMVKNIVIDTGKAGALGYGAGFITEGIASGMNASSKQLIRSLGGAGVPAAMVSFGIETYDSVSAYAQGKIDGTELAYDLGDGAASVAGSMVGAQYGAAIGTAIMPGVGTVAGGLVGGMVGYAVTSEAYKTAVEYGSEGADYLGDKAKEIANDTIELTKDNIPDKVENIRASLNTFSAENNLPFSF